MAELNGKKIIFSPHVHINGEDTSDATAYASEILFGKTAYARGSKLTGTILSKTAQTYTPTTTDQTIASGQYLSGNQTIKGDANLVAGNIVNGVTIFGVSGSAPVPDTETWTFTLDDDTVVTKVVQVWQ